MNGQTEFSPDAQAERSIDERFRTALEDKDQEAIEYFGLALLLSRRLYAQEFAMVMDAIIDSGKMSPGWKSAFERAYEAQPENRRVLYRDPMVKLYLSLREYHTAAKFLPAKPELPQELADAMEVYLQLKRRDDAKAIAERCGQKMVVCRDAGSLHILLRTLRRYHRAEAEREAERVAWRDLMMSLEDRWEKSSRETVATGG
jgi:hypothetical protein